MMSIRAAYIFLLLSLLSFGVNAQYTNSWINYSQPYYKFPITQDGVYRITYDALISSGVPVNSIPPANIQMFGRGEELYIHIEGEGDGSFDPGDYIEFYAQRNDGYFDVEAYDQPSSHGNPYYSLFNDTAVYFLTLGTQPGLRMQEESDVNFQAYAPSPYFLKEVISIFGSSYYFGETYPTLNGSTNPQYTKAEGFFGPVFGLGATPPQYNDGPPLSFSFTLNTPDVYSPGPQAIVKTNLIGSSRDDYTGVQNNHHTRITIGSHLAIDSLYGGYMIARFNKFVPLSALSASNTITATANNDNGQYYSRNAIAFFSLKYAHTPNVPGTSVSKIFVPDHLAQSKTLFNFSGFSDQGTSARLYDLTNHKRIPVVFNGTVHQALIPNSGSEKECILTNDSQITANSIVSLTPVGTDQSGYFQNMSGFLVPPDYYIVTNKNLWAEAQSYKVYRNLSGYNAEVFDVDELYDQFAQGIRKNPMAIRNFSDYAYHIWGPDTMQHLLLLGKSIYPYACRTNAINYEQCLVPSFGYPTCDILITSGLGGNLFEPAIPVGRVAAKTPGQAQDYLDKVVEYEGAEPAEWRKRGLHFCGGADGPQNDLLCHYVDVFKEIIEDSLYGAFVQTFSKSNSQPFQITQADSIRELIEAGVSFMTFFGHASGGGFDVNTDDVSTYNNEGKYPLIFGNSCLSGDIHNVPGASLSMSEPWVLHSDKGAIGFIASVGVALTGALARYGDSLYVNLASKNYNRTIGRVMKQTVADVQVPDNVFYNFPVIQSTLHGDPALKINTHPLPDLAISQPNVYFTNPDACCTPIDLTTELDSFDVNVIVNNLGRTYENNLILAVTRILPGNINGGTMYKSFSPVYFKDTIPVRFPVNPVYGTGLNQLNIHVDDNYSLNELSETNNGVTINFLVQSPDIVPVYPYKFAIIGEQAITLKASTGDPFAPTRTYMLQVDTTDRFNSPLMEYTSITQGGGVVNWTPSLLAAMPPNTVYFWRASLDTNLYLNHKWRESSFQYIPGRSGWGQSHFFQFKPDDTTGYEGDKYNFIDHNRPYRKFDFINTPKNISCHNIGHPSTLDEGYGVLWKIDSEIQDYLACGGTSILNPQVIVAVVDNNTLEPWGSPGLDLVTGLAINQDHNFGQMNINGSCGRPRSENFFFWPQNNTGALNTFLTSFVPDSFYILMYSWIPNEVVYYENLVLNSPGTFVNWSQETIDVFHSIGFDEIEDIDLHNPWAFFCKKGDIASAFAVIGDNPHAVVDLNAEMRGTWNKGTITTPLIGPSAGWNWMYWDRHPSETPTDDTLNFKVTGVRFNGTEEEVIPYFQVYPLTGPGPDSLSLTGLIDHTEFPYIKLSAFTQDDTTRTPTQMERWQIMYDQVPEAALNPNIGYQFLSPEVDQFQDIVFTTAIENIGDYDMTDLLVKYWIQKADNDTINIFYPRQGPLLVDGVLIDTITVPTASITGNNKLWVEVNPYDSLGRPDQLEQYHFNNIGFVQFAVNGDRINPILDVSFDGIHILDGDIVSARPFITMTIDDENQHLIMNDINDTTHITVMIIHPDGQQEVMNFTPGELEFVPASAPDNKAVIKYNAVFAEDGIYKLFVQGSDKSNNSSGAFRYTISFEVINRSTITEVLNYPNPFSTSTRFVFVLTGSVIPDYFKIQVMTITGKVVREITTDELGPVNIGRNITQYAWNGKDEFGDQLANGVYLYSVTAYINGEDIEHRNSGADKFFKKNFGKMFLMR